ncbi:hypothetical protein BU24DRAFT_104316 [Aaosphaeria arxii CBS 175.79]|uniref:Uncharacterized protein n=1 Tax=Aaosphaeria arxii CBS 175.79 TaxID=1450172 RepID=A0A6A5Y0J2_9PLEO|nr:uncharacterized protein BU24DRAFT_104316 [Aaosphaeria arxii CBS 175.79]KAF2018746.1 hypothetical protein BU24DRAFT_104316 [Aaosphaeria arxii CBS 175.79]
MGRRRVDGKGFSSFLSLFGKRRVGMSLCAWVSSSWGGNIIQGNTVRYSTFDGCTFHVISRDGSVPSGQGWSRSSTFQAGVEGC